MSGRKDGEKQDVSRNALRLLILSRDRLFRESLASATATTRGYEVGAAGSGEEALRHLSVRPFDVLLIGLSPLDSRVAELIREVIGRFQATRVLVLSCRECKEEIVTGFEAGARGHVFRSQSLAELCWAVDAVARGEVVCSRRAARYLFGRLAGLGQERRHRLHLGTLELTVRELQIVQLIAQGRSNQEIAEKLFLSVHTVKNHVHNILERLGVANRWDAVRRATERGWLKADAFRSRQRMPG